MSLSPVLGFLSRLAANNNKEWMDANKKDYLKQKEVFVAFIDQLLKALVPLDEGLTGLQPKDCIFRINRDIRFSPNKSPYKNNFGAAMSPGGKKSPNALYYIHLQPGNSFIAGGIYQPDAEYLKKIRQEIDYNAAELKKIADQPDFKRYFGSITGEALKTMPKGYPADHPNAELLKFKSYLVSHNFTDQEVGAADFFARCMEIYRVMVPFNNYLNVAIS